MLFDEQVKLTETIRAQQLADAKFRTELAEREARERIRVANATTGTQPTAGAAALSAAANSPREAAASTASASAAIPLTPIDAAKIHQDWQGAKAEFLGQIAPEQDPHRQTLLLSQVVINDGNRLLRDVANRVPFEQAWDSLVARHRPFDWQCQRVRMLINRVLPRNGET
jgi:hypothetical protein